MICYYDCFFVLLMVMVRNHSFSINSLPDDILALSQWKAFADDKWIVTQNFTFVYAAINSISVISRRQFTLFTSSWVSPIIGWGPEVSCPWTLPRKIPEDPVQLEPRTPGLRVKHFNTEPRRTPLS